MRRATEREIIVFDEKKLNSDLKKFLAVISSLSDSELGEEIAKQLEIIAQLEERKRIQSLDS